MLPPDPLTSLRARRALPLLLALLLCGPGFAGGSVLRLYEVSDLQRAGKWWEAALSRVKHLAGDEGTLTEGPDHRTLVLSAPAAVHERVAEELLALRKFLGRMVEIETRIVRVGAPAAGGLPERVTAEGLAAFLGALRGEPVAAPRLVCGNGQAATISVLSDVSYVSDFDVEVGQDCFLADPIVSTVQSGISLDLRAFTEEDGTGVRIVFRASRTEVVSPMPSVRVELPFGLAGEIQVPEARTVSTTRLIRCEPGSFTVVDLGEGFLALVGARPSSAGDEER